MLFRSPEDDKYIQNGDVALIIPNEEKIDKRFAYYLISSNLVKSQLSAAAQQTKIRHTSPDKIKDCKVFIPELTEQKKIAQILDSINNKIELNNRMNEKLEAMSKRLYDYWFVQFDFPNAEGKPYKSSGGKMVYNEQLKREIPEGWEVSTLGKLCKFGNGVNYNKNEEGNTLYKIVNVRDITASSTLIDCNSLDKLKLDYDFADRYLVDENDILIARSGTPGSVRLCSKDRKSVV